MTPFQHNAARDLVESHASNGAVEHIAAIHSASMYVIRYVAKFTKGRFARPIDAAYPHFGIGIGRAHLHVDACPSYGVLLV